MVLKPYLFMPNLILLFENDVKMYGTQTISNDLTFMKRFENDVKMYGTQTEPIFANIKFTFENDVKMYGTQTLEY